MAENEPAGDQGFLARWSKRKQAAREAEALPEPQPTPEPVEAAALDAKPEPEPEIDPATLPPIESIQTGADLQAFLQKGVPKALKQAALRRLWSADATIRDFREVADYDWDFNAPGYGALLPKDDPGAVADELLAAIRRRATPQQAAAAEPETVEQTPDEPVEPAARPTTAEAESPRPTALATATAAPAPEPHPAPPSPKRRRRHGAATPS